MAEQLTSQERKHLERVLFSGFLMRWIAGVIVLVSIIYSAIVLMHPNVFLGRTIANANLKRQTLEQYFDKLEPQTDLERELIKANRSWINTTWQLSINNAISLKSMFAAFLLCIGILTWFFSNILIKIGRLIQKDRKFSN